MGLRLGFYYHVTAHQQDGIWMPGYLGRFVDSLAVHFTQFTVFLHSSPPSEWAMHDYQIQAQNVWWIDMGPSASVPMRSVFANRYLQPIRRNSANLDVLLLRGPSPLLPAAAELLNGMPVALLLVGDYLSGVSELRQPGWRKEFIRLWARWYGYRQLQAAKKNLTIVNSRQLWRDYQGKAGRLVEIKTTTLGESDFYYKENTCLVKPIQVLYAGRIERAKGILDIAEALALLGKKGLDFHFNLVGWAEKKDPIISEVQSFMDDHGLHEHYTYHGYKAVGPELYTYYKQADLYVIGSRSNFEGFPRSIWEAMAHSTPVVATRVGSIPDFIAGAAVLVEPARPEALAAGIEELINNSPLRQNHIRTGLELARQNTLEGQAEKLAHAIEEWVSKR